MTAKQLTDSILQMAIQGKLVPQDPNDEPASVLLERIREEKRRLVAEGKLKKKELEENNVNEDDLAFVIPKGWVAASLKTLSLDSADGPFGSNLKKDHYTDNKEVRIIQLSNIGESGWKDSNVKYTTYEHLETIKRSEAYPGDIIIAKMMPAGRAIICPDCDNKFVLSSDAVRFNFSNVLYKKYLYYAINSSIFKNQVYGNVQGITRVRTSLTKLRDYYLPIPPIKEQYRIVDRIEEILPFVAEYGEAYEEASKMDAELPDKLKKSILQEAIQGKLGTQNPSDEPARLLIEQIRELRNNLAKKGIIKKKDLTVIPIEEDEIPFSIPDTWEWVRLNELLTIISDGTHKTPNYVPSGIPFLSVQNISSGKLSLDKIKYVTKEEHRQLIKRVEPQKGDILLCRIGTLGKAIKIYWDFEFSIFVSLGLLRPVMEAIADYIVFCINSPLGTRWILDNRVGGGTHTYKINLSDIPNFIIPLPPLKEQARIFDKIKEIFAEIDNMTSNNIIKETGETEKD